ncbi:hypothetical protein IQ07DRAFT_377794 [Pyrenochaeta sp. DS3sAY3a]|nr:hypothetical protein IQ07DRAFT_377794 [Pyrenochaeta sp. DS3sAY3a]
MDVVTLNIEPGHLWSAGIIWPIVCTVVVGARFATRRAYSRLGWDDWLSIPALICLYGLSAAVIYGVATKSLGYPDENYNFNYIEYQSRTLTINRKIYWSSSVVLAATLGFIKLSCLAFYHRAFKTGVYRVAEAILWSLIVITVIWSISFTVANLLFCGNLSHLEWLWSRGGDYLKCTTDTYMLQQSFAISDVVTDALIVLYPLPFVARLQISLARKVAIAFIFLLGSATIAMSAVRLEVLLQAVKVTKELVVGNPSVGPGNILTATTYFMIMEAGFGLCAICLPTLSSSTKIPGVQTFFQNVSKVFSLRSNTSVTSGGSRDEIQAVREKPS